MKKIVLIALFGVTVVVNAREWQDFMINSPQTRLALQDTSGEYDATEGQTYYLGSKSVPKALFFSAVVPGAGQLYAGSWWKALGFLTIEAASWYFYSDYQREGKDIEDEYMTYADANWSEDQYWLAIASMSGKSADDIEALRDWEHLNFSHGLHREKDQQYYEMIGKYNQFNYGWNDIYGSTPRPTDPLVYQREQILSEKRLYYEQRRDASNRAFKHATTSLTVVMFNHIVSALEAVWTVSRHNRTIAEARIYFEPRLMDQQRYTALTLRMDW